MQAEECFREMRRMYSYFVKGMEYYSTALWHLQKDTELSALSQELTEQHRFAPEVHSGYLFYFDDYSIFVFLELVQRW